MDHCPSFFEQQTSLFDLVDFFQKKILISPKDVKSRFALFNKKNLGKFQVSFFSSMQTTEDLFLSERSCFKKNISTDCGDFTIEVKVVQDVAVDIEPFFEQLGVILINRLYEPNLKYQDGFKDDRIGYWVIDEADNILLINDLGKKALRSIKGNAGGLNPRACVVDNEVYLIIPKSKNSLRYYIAYLVNERTLSLSTNNLLKELTLESSILAHEIRNALTGIKFGLEIIKDENEEVREVANELMVGVDKCFSVVQTFLNFNKELKNKKMISLNSITRDVKKFLGPRANVLSLKFNSENINLNVKNESLLFLTLYLFFSEMILFFHRQKSIKEKEVEVFELDISVHENKNIFFSINAAFSLNEICDKNISQYLLLKSLFNLNGLNLKSSHVYYILEDNC